jgi:hypothetical protein
MQSVIVPTRVQQWFGFCCRNICSMFWITPGRFWYRLVFILPFSKTGPWLKSIAEVMIAGKLRVNVDAVFSLEQAVYAPSPFQPEVYSAEMSQC